MDLLIIFCHILLLCFNPSAATSLITADIFEARGQRVCKAGKGKPCYKLAYFSELRRKLNFVEAGLACRRDGGQLLSVESLAEQKVIEQLITELRPTDGDFWIGLRRNHGDGDSITDCSSQYYWVDGSKSTYRNWHWDEPSCGYEVCVVMYHQPSAPPGLGGLYMFQWNDDNCETKNNFICKYTAEKTVDPSPSPNSTQTDIIPSSVQPSNTNYQDRTLNLVYIIIPTIPLILLFLTVTGVCCYKLLTGRQGIVFRCHLLDSFDCDSKSSSEANQLINDTSTARGMMFLRKTGVTVETAKRRKQQKSEVCQTEPGHCPSPKPTDVYNVIRSQKDDDLVSTRPHTKNTSFLCSSPDTPTGDYDNLGGRDTESGFVTLASTESCFLNFDLTELSLGRRGTRDFYDTSLGRSGKRDLNDSSLGRTGHREFYDRSLGRRTTKSEHYGSSVYGDHELYDSSVRAGSELYEPKLRPAPTIKADLYQTYINNGKDDTYQTTLGTWGPRKSYQANLDCYRNGLTLDRRYFNEQDWIKRENY